MKTTGLYLVVETKERRIFQKIEKPISKETAQKAYEQIKKDYLVNREPHKAHIEILSI